MDNDSELDWALERLHFHINEPRSAKFQEYYFHILSNRDFFLNSEEFFTAFKYNYSLQGINKSYLSSLENAKPRILNLIDERKLSQLYLEYFARANIKHGNKEVERNLASFFTKLVRTFLPADYCALDNPIKNYFGLKNEGFFIAFLVVSELYKRWLTNNSRKIEYIKRELKLTDGNNLLVRDELTNLKILDLIFWAEANPFGRNQPLN